MLWCLILGITVTCLSQCGLAAVPKVALQDIDVYYPHPNWSNSLDWKLMKEFAPRHSNLLLSPISLRIVLSLLYQGSGGVTERELASVLEFKDQSSTKEEFKAIIGKLQLAESAEYVLNLGTRIFLDSPIQPQQKFASLARDYYKTDIALTNFSNTLEAGRSINSWVEKLTNGKISKLINPGDLEDAIMVIANAIYFKGTWRYPFAIKNIENRFLVPNGDNFFAVNAKFMSTEDKFYYHESTKLDAKILRLPYKGGRYSMFIVLPNSIGGLPSLIHQINVNNLKGLLQLMDLRQVQVTIPKFKFNFQARFSRALQEFGLIQMFQNTASFPGIARGNSTILRKLVVSDVIQKSGIEVNEYGSVAYAASEVTIGNKFGEVAATFNAIHPFMFYIEEDISGIILFVGKVENPLGTEAAPLEPKPEN